MLRLRQVGFASLAYAFLLAYSIGPVSIRAAESLELAHSNATVTHTCNGSTDSIQISGDNNTVTLLGRCSALQVAGNHNHVQIDTVLAVQTTGDDNLVEYSGDRPSFSNTGSRNVLTHIASSSNSATRI